VRNALEDLFGQMPPAIAQMRRSRLAALNLLRYRFNADAVQCAFALQPF